MPYYASQVANFFIARGQSENKPVDPLKMQKLVYLAHGWHLLFLGTPLISEKIEAWRYGPVVPPLYRMFRDYRSAGIDRLVPEPQGAIRFDPTTANLLEQVWNTYKNRSGIELSMLLHEPGYAWDLTRRANETPWSDAVIDNRLIQDEFRERQARG